jgi:uncharacterized protein (DUF3084 family)
LSRNPKIESILVAWYSSIHCEPSERAEKRKERDTLIQSFIGTAPYTVDQVLDTLHAQFQEYRKMRRKSEALAGGQQAPNNPPSR